MAKIGALAWLWLTFLWDIKYLKLGHNINKGLEPSTLAPI